MKKHTVFITGIVIRQVGNGVWGCIRKVMIPRRMLHLHERISQELSLTEEIVSMFTEERKKSVNRYCPACCISRGNVHNGRSH
ncbi:ribonuclease H-like YkuK family protein [Peribacillus frigoritolerans]|nr:ribonuclease H-like YkuK family protein [Peribacillus frigoritolerans]